MDRHNFFVPIVPNKPKSKQEFNAKKKEAMEELEKEYALVKCKLSRIKNYRELTSYCKRLQHLSHPRTMN